MSRPNIIKLPVGPHPGWETEAQGVSEDGPVHSVAESFLVLQSLRQSRNRWITSMFPKFSAKSRGGRPAEVTPPPHTIKAHGRFELTIGPHIFPNTAIYEVHYLPQAPTPAPSYTLSPVPQLAADMSHVQQSAPQAAEQAAQTSPLISSLGSDAFVTPALISQVNAAAASNPTLSNLLYLAAAGRASPDQLKTLGLLIQSLGAMSTQSSQVSQPAVPATSSPSSAPSPVKPFDLVIEFQERTSDRWIFPRGPVVCERVPLAESTSRKCDLIVSTSFPFSRSGASQQNGSGADMPVTSASADGYVPQKVSFRWGAVPQTVCDLFMIWIGGETKMTENREELDALKISKRTYLQYQLAEGDPLLNQVQAAVAPPYATKPIKPPNTDSRAKRKTTSRKVTSEVTQGSSSNPASQTPAAKRKRQTKPKASTAAPIACRACSQTDVPLMMGGRFCRPCIDAGKITEGGPTGPVPDTDGTLANNKIVGHASGTATAPPLAHSPLAPNPPPPPPEHPTEEARS